MVENLSIQKVLAPTLTSRVKKTGREKNKNRQRSFEEELKEKKEKKKRLSVDMGVEFRPIKINQGSRKVIALIGPSGVGKTTTAAKLAAVWKLQKKRDVALIIMDDHRIGAVDQIKIYSKIIGVPVEIVSDKNELREALKKLKHKDLVIIDTPSLNCRNDLELEKFYKYFEKMNNIETHLLLSATTKEKNFIDISERLNKVKIDRLIFTKIDESITHGNILSHLIRTKIPVSCFTCGQKVPESIS